MHVGTPKGRNMGTRFRGRRRIGAGLNPGGACCLIVSLTLWHSGGLSNSPRFKAAAQRMPTAADCTGLRVVVLPDGRITCTPGRDPAPDGVDPSVPRPLVPAQAQGMLLPDPLGGAPTNATAAATAGVPC